MTYFTIEDKSGNQHVSSHPSDGTRSIVDLYPMKEQAEDRTVDFDDPQNWRVVEVDQKQWLEKMLLAGCTDVYDGSSCTDIRFLLTSLRAISHGRNLIDD